MFITDMFITDHHHNGPLSKPTTFVTDHIDNRPVHYRPVHKRTNS